MARVTLSRRRVVTAGAGTALLAALAIVISAVTSTAPPAHTASPHPGFVDSMDSTLAPAWATGQTFTRASPNLSRDDAPSLTSMPWRFVSLDGKVLRVVWATGDGACVLPQGFAVTYTKTSVELWALSKTDTSQAACPARLMLGAAAVRLAQPLNGRALVHAPTDPQWPNSRLPSEPGHRAGSKARSAATTVEETNRRL